MNRLFVANKDMFLSSNAFLNRIKRRYRVKKAGFSGTLDPFACGNLIIAFGSYTKLFRFLKKYPKIYRTTLWLGAYSPSLDIERIEKIKDISPFSKEKIEEVVHSFKGKFTYIPPKFSAKKIEGKRAYSLAAKKEDIFLKKVTSTIYDIKLINYSHPFVTFEATVSEGTYVRSLGEAIAKKLGVEGALSYLERLAEGLFRYENEKELNPLEYLNTKENFTTLSKDEIFHGKKITLKDVKFQEEGIYHIAFEDFFAIVEIKKDRVQYILNQIPLKRSYEIPS